MQVEVIHERLAPCMQHCDKAQLAFESPLRIVSESLESLVDRGEEDIEHYPFVAQEGWIEIVGQCEHHMEIAAGNELSFTILQPSLFGQRLALRTVTVAA